MREFCTTFTIKHNERQKYMRHLHNLQELGYRVTTRKRFGAILKDDTTKIFIYCK